MKPSWFLLDPKLDDVSEVIAAIRRDDAACGKIGQVFDSSGGCPDDRRGSRSVDALERHQELDEKLDLHQKYLMNQTDPGWTPYLPCPTWI
jgi:hypothetical protein